MFHRAAQSSTEKSQFFLPTLRQSPTRRESKFPKTKRKLSLLTIRTRWERNQQEGDGDQTLNNKQFGIGLVWATSLHQQMCGWILPKIVVPPSRRVVSRESENSPCESGSTSRSVKSSSIPGPIATQRNADDPSAEEIPIDFGLPGLCSSSSQPVSQPVSQV